MFENFQLVRLFLEVEFDKLDFGLEVEFDKLDFQAILMHPTWSCLEVEFVKLDFQSKVKFAKLDFQKQSNKLNNFFCVLLS